jgi:hypothetical protein
MTYAVFITCVHPAENIIRSVITLEYILPNNSWHAFLGNFLFEKFQEI